MEAGKGQDVNKYCITGYPVEYTVRYGNLIQPTIWVCDNKKKNGAIVLHSSQGFKSMYMNRVRQLQIRVSA